MGDLLAITALTLFSCNAFVVRAASARLEQGLGFLVVLIANVAFAGTVAGALALTGGVREPSWSAVGLFLLAGILSSYLGRRGYFRSVQTMGPSRAAAVQVTNPVFAFLFAWLLLGQGLAWWDAAALVVVVLGLSLTSQVRGSSVGGTTRMIRMPLRVLGPALVAAVCYGLGNVARGAAVQQWTEPVLGGLLGALAGLGAYLLIHISIPRLLADLRAADRRGLGLWTLAGGITIAGQIAVIGATYYIPIAVAVAISSALPILVIPVSVLVLGNVDQVSPRTVVGALAIVAGVVALVLG